MEYLVELLEGAPDVDAAEVVELLDFGGGDGAIVDAEIVHCQRILERECTGFGDVAYHGFLESQRSSRRGVETRRGVG
jgi:hypothetical protein